MDFGLSPAATHLRENLLTFMDQCVYASEAYAEQHAVGDEAQRRAVIEDLKATAKQRGLWNLFLPYQTEWTDGLSNVDYAPLAEIMGRSPIAAELCNCSAPDTGNMEILAMFGSAEQKAQWLHPLLEGAIRSCFAMTEPAVASSDATNVELLIERDDGEYVLNGRKWFVSGAMHPRCAVSIVMGKTDVSAKPHRQQSMVLVPMNTPGMTVGRNMKLFGYEDPDGHCEIEYVDVRVPIENVIGGEGEGFAIAQARLGPGRVHHCMRTIGAAERALELMCTRLLSRNAFGKAIAQHGAWEERIADARIALDQARLYVLHTAWLMDKEGNRRAQSQIAGMKAVVPKIALDVIDDAIQAYGAAGVSQDTPLAAMYSSIRCLRIADGPDEVHRRVVARRELEKHRVAPD